jgi:hypothetical protein
MGIRGLGIQRDMAYSLSGFALTSDIVIVELRIYVLNMSLGKGNRYKNFETTPTELTLQISRPC